jgi:DNA end-binding protein Ku
MRPVWKGSLSFGLVNIPVQLYSAVRSSEHVSFRMLHKTDLSPIKYERVCERERKPVPWKDIVKGYEYAKGKYVVLTPEDFKSAQLESSKTLEILDFVDEQEVDPRYFETPYYLVPSKGGEKAYALLREAVRRTGSVGIGKIIMRQKQHLAGIKAVGDALVLEIMRFANELIDAGELALPGAEQVRAPELQMAEQLIASLAEPFDPSKYHDEYREGLMRVIRAKMKGKKIEAPEEEAEPAGTPVIDLMERLRQSLDQGKQRGAVRSARKRAASHERKRTKRARRRSA